MSRFLNRLGLPAALPIVTLLALVACTGERIHFGQVDPSRDDTRKSEECGNGLDDDGDRRIEEGCPCGIGERQSCYTHTAPSRGLGRCADGVQRCVGPGVEFGEWGSCEGARLPGRELCDGRDGDCDGAVDEGCPCDPGQTRSCGPRTTRGQCGRGEQRCAEDGTWTGCHGATFAGVETCGNDVDDDCDGKTDEECQCTPQPETCGDGIDQDCDGETDEAACGNCGRDRSCPVPPRPCQSSQECPDGSLCSLETGRCVQPSGEACGMPPTGSGAQSAFEPCAPEGSVRCERCEPCAAELTCVTREAKFNADSLELEPFEGICMPACDPCSPQCPDGMSCLVLPGGGGACQPDALPLGQEGERCTMGGTERRLICAAGMTCVGSIDAYCVRPCRKRPGTDPGPTEDCMGDRLCIGAEGSSPNHFVGSCRHAQLVGAGQRCGTEPPDCEQPWREDSCELRICREPLGCINARCLTPCESDADCPGGGCYPWGNVGDLCVPDGSFELGQACHEDRNCSGTLICNPDLGVADDRGLCDLDA